MHKPSSPFLASIYEQMLLLRYSMATIEGYLYGIRYFIRFYQLAHPAFLGEEAVGQFLIHLAAKTQAQALNALVFLYKTILRRPLMLEIQFRPSKRSPKLPTVLTQVEVRSLLLAIPARLQLDVRQRVTADGADAVAGAGHRLSLLVRHGLAWRGRQAQTGNPGFRATTSAACPDRGGAALLPSGHSERAVGRGLVAGGLGAQVPQCRP